MSYGSSAGIARPGRTCDNGDDGDTTSLQPQPQPAPASSDRSNGTAVKDGRIIGTYRYVPMELVDGYREKGWALADGLNLNGTYHGEFARLMKEPE